MSYFEDLTPYSYYHLGVLDNTFNVGWLDKEHLYPKGITEDEIVEKLWLLLHFRVLQLRGFHVCEFCVPLSKAPMPAERNGEIIHLGFSEIRVIGENGKIYAAPDLIYHYIVSHSYKPPEEFTDALRKGPMPNSVEYQIKLNKLIHG
jgi:hypothetical protein